MPSAFAGTHVAGVYSVGASPAVMATVNGNSEYGLVFAQRNKTVTYNNILYANNIVTAYFDVNGNLNDGNGNAWIDLVPDANAAPDDSYYVVTINIQGSIHSEIWIVPDQTSASVVSVRQTTAPPSGTSNFYYQTLQQSGASLAQRPTLNFSGAGMSCLDNAGLQRTDCTMTSGGFANPMTSTGDLIVGGAAGGATRLALGSSNLCLTSNGATAVWGSCSAGAGTVTSFSSGNLSPLFTASVATATTTPALTFALTNQNANLFYAGPGSGIAAAPTFRSLVGADLPNPSTTALGGIESITCSGSDFINSVSISGVPGCATPAGSGTVTTSGSPVANQVSYFTSASAITGTVTDTNTTHALFATAGAPAFRAFAGSDLPAGWNPVTASNGGSGVASPTAHLVLVAEGSSPFAPVPAGTAGQALISNGAGADPTFQDPIVSGPDAVGAAPTKNPVQTGCLFLTTPTTLTNDQVGALQCTAAQRLIVDGSQVTQPVSGTFWQATQPVSGTFWQATQPVSGAVTANQGGTWTVQPGNTANTTAWKVDGSAVTQPVSGTFWQATQPVSGTVTANAGTGSFTVAQATGSNLHIACDSGCGGAATFADNGAFTAGTTSVSNDGFVYNDAIAALTSGSAGAARVTSDRMIYFNLGKVGNTAISLGQTTMASSLPVTISSNQSAVPVSGTFWQATQPVSAASLPLPSGASIAAKQPALGTAGTASADVITVQGIASMTALKVDGSAVTQPVSGTFWQATQPVSGTVTANAGTGSFTVAQATAANLNATVTGTVTTTPPANASTNITQIGGTAVVADPCQANVKSYVSINQTAGAQLVTGTSAKKIYPCSINLVSATAQNVALVEGTGTVCATGTSGVLGFGGSTAATGWNLSANGGLTYGDGRGALGQEGVAADNLCLLQSSTGQISGGLSYVVQ